MISIASGCPFAISDEHITTQVPSDTSSTLVGIEHRAAGAIEHFSRHVRLCQILSEIHGVQFFDQALPCGASNYTDWMQSTERSVQDWQDWFAIDGSIPGWAVRAADRCRLLLYRPCSRNIAPDGSCLRKACEVAIRMINRDCTVDQADGLLLTFQDVFDAFQASMILIYVVGNANTLELGSAIDLQAHQALELLYPLFVSPARPSPSMQND